MKKLIFIISFVIVAYIVMGISYAAMPVDNVYTTHINGSVNIGDKVDIYISASGDATMPFEVIDQITSDPASYDKVKIKLNNGGYAILKSIESEYIDSFTYSCIYFLKFEYEVSSGEEVSDLDLVQDISDPEYGDIIVESGYDLIAGQDFLLGEDSLLDGSFVRNIMFFDSNANGTNYYNPSTHTLVASEIQVTNSSSSSQTMTQVNDVYTTHVNGSVSVGEEIDIYVSIDGDSSIPLVLLDNTGQPANLNLIKIKLNNGAYAILENYVSQTLYSDKKYLKFKYVVASGEEINGLDLVQDINDPEYGDIVLPSGYTFTDKQSLYLGEGSLLNGSTSMHIKYWDTTSSGNELFYSSPTSALLDSNIDITTVISGDAGTPGGDIVIIIEDSSKEFKPPVDVEIPEELKGEEFKKKINDTAEELSTKLENATSYNKKDMMNYTLDFLGNVNTSLKNNELTEKEINSLVELTKKVEDLVKETNNEEFRVKYTTKYLDKLAPIVKTMDKTSEDAKKLRKVSREISKVAVTKLGEVYVPFGETITKDSTFGKDLKEKLKNYNENFKKIQDSLELVVGEFNVKPLKPELTLKFKREGRKEIKTTIDKDIINEIGKAGVEKVGFEQNSVKIAVETKEMLKAKKKFEIKMDYEKIESKLPEGTEALGEKLVSDINVYVDDIIKHSFNRPLTLTFNLKELGLDLTEDEKKRLLVIYRLNEKTNEWEAVGGKYNPTTDEITTLRFSLSKYAVMKTTKHFSDVESSWAKDKINEMLGKGILDKRDVFKPNDKITRAEFTAWVVRAYNLNDNGKDVKLKDVDKNNPYYEEIKLAYQSGIISGTGDGKFEPDKEMTREEVAVLISRAIKKYEGAKATNDIAVNLAKYDDKEEAEDWSTDSLALLDELNVIDTKDGLKPKENLTKEEAVAMLNNVYTTN